RTLVGGPWGDEQTQQGDGGDNGQRKQQDWSYPSRDAHAGAEPDHHFAVAMPAGQGQQYCKKQRQRQQHGQIPQQGKTQQGIDGVAGQAASGGNTDVIGHTLGQDDSKQYYKCTDCSDDQLAQQGSFKKHTG